MIRPAAAAVLATVLAAGPPARAQVSATDVIDAGRYTRVVAIATEEQQHPLLAVVSIAFPTQIATTTGEALAHLLARSGYRLASPDEVAADAAVAHLQFIGFALPEVHRRFDAVRLVHILEALGGDSHQPVIDHASRTVWFTSRAPAAATADAVPATETAPVVEQVWR
jgi:type IV pili sensor histidine kinase/response regulator